MDSSSRHLQPAASAPNPEWAKIDASVKVPVLCFLFAAAAWLVTATALGCIATLQLVQPTFLADCAWTTHGRIAPLFRHALVYGWGCNAAFAILIWLTARLCRAPALGWGVTVAGGLFWNVGLKFGLVAIMLGQSTGHFLLEIPGAAAAIMFVSYGLVGAGIVVIFSRRREGNLFASQWYLLAALFWFPWLFTIGQSTLVFDTMRGTAQVIAATWYAANVYALFLAPIALGALYYVIPKRVGRPISHYPFAKVGFWSFGFFGSFAGLSSLISSPVPAWVQTLGVASTIMFLIPLVAIGLNLLGTLVAGRTRGGDGSALRFAKFSLVSWVVLSVLDLYVSSRAVAATTQFTQVGDALNQLRWYAFASMAFFSVIYFLVPRITVKPLPSDALAATHFWSSAGGIVVVVASLLLAGFAQGHAINDTENFPLFADVTGVTTGYRHATVGGFLILAIGHLAFLVNVVMAIYQAAFGKPAATAASLFPDPPVLEANS